VMAVRAGSTQTALTCHTQSCCRSLVVTCHITAEPVHATRRREGRLMSMLYFLVTQGRRSWELGES